MDSVVLILSLALGLILLFDCVAAVALIILLAYRYYRQNCTTRRERDDDNVTADEPYYSTVGPATPSSHQHAENIELNTNLSYGKTGQTSHAIIDTIYDGIYENTM